MQVQVERAKKCLDFAATLYLIHLAVVSIVGGFPTSVAWCAAGKCTKAPGLLQPGY
jgi:hypothetical protein